MDHLSGLGRLGFGWQDVERVYFLFILRVCFPANTCLTAMHLSQGSQWQHSIAHEQSCTNKSISSMQSEVPASQACTGQAALSLGTIWSSGREGRKTVSNSRSRGSLTDGPLSTDGKTKLWEGAWWRLPGSREDVEVRDLCSGWVMGGAGAGPPKETAHFVSWDTAFSAQVSGFKTMGPVPTPAPSSRTCTCGGNAAFSLDVRDCQRGQLPSFSRGCTLLGLSISEELCSQEHPR